MIEIKPIKQITDTAENIRTNMVLNQTAFSTTADVEKGIITGSQINRVGGEFVVPAISSKINATTGVAALQKIKAANGTADNDVATFGQSKSKGAEGSLQVAGPSGTFNGSDLLIIAGTNIRTLGPEASFGTASGSSIHFDSTTATVGTPIAHPNATADGQSATLGQVKATASNLLESSSENQALHNLLKQCSSLWVSGCNLTQDATHITISAGVVTTRTDTTETSPFRNFNTNQLAIAKTTIANSTTLFVYADSSTTLKTVVASPAFALQSNNVPLYIITRRYDGAFSIDDIRALNQDARHNAIVQRLLTKAITKDASSGSLAVTGANFAVSSMNLFFLDLLTTIPAYNSATTQFVQTYRNGSGGFTQTLRNAIQFDRFDDGDGGLGTIAPNKYSNQWVFVDSAGTGPWYVVPGWSQFDSPLQASAESIPPSRVGELGDFTTYEPAFRLCFSGAGAWQETEDLFATSGRLTQGNATPSLQQVVAVDGAVSLPITSSGNNVWAGNNTFSGNVVVPAADQPTEAVQKSQLDDAVSGIQTALSGKQPLSIDLTNFTTWWDVSRNAGGISTGWIGSSDDIVSIWAKDYMQIGANVRTKSDTTSEKIASGYATSLMMYGNPSVSDLFKFVDYGSGATVTETYPIRGTRSGDFVITGNITAKVTGITPTNTAIGNGDTLAQIAGKAQGQINDVKATLLNKANVFSVDGLVLYFDGTFLRHRDTSELRHVTDAEKAIWNEPSTRLTYGDSVGPLINPTTAQRLSEFLVSPTKGGFTIEVYGSFMLPVASAFPIGIKIGADPIVNINTASFGPNGVAYQFKYSAECRVNGTSWNIVQTVEVYEGSDSTLIRKGAKVHSTTSAQDQYVGVWGSLATSNAGNSLSVSFSKLVK